MKDGVLRVGAANCTAGRYSTGSADSCTSCGTGFSDAGASKCEYCGPGEYMNEADDLSKSCLPCAAGTFSETGANSLDGCLPCDTGKFSEQGSAYCSRCGLGEGYVGAERMSLPGERRCSQMRTAVR